jgi:hypothetical protein
MFTQNIRGHPEMSIPFDPEKAFLVYKMLKGLPWATR